MQLIGGVPGKFGLHLLQRFAAIQDFIGRMRRMFDDGIQFISGRGDMRVANIFDLEGGDFGLGTRDGAPKPFQFGQQNGFLGGQIARHGRENGAHRGLDPVAFRPLGGSVRHGPAPFRSFRAAFQH